MEKCKFMSVFAPYMQKFVDAKEALGFSRKYFESVLGLLDRFFIEEKGTDSFYHKCTDRQMGTYFD